MEIRARSALSIVVLASSLVFSGCASIVTGSTQEMTFDSNPDGALVSVNGRPMGRTPLVIRLNKDSEDQELTFSKEGYRTASFPIASKVNPWFWGNIVCGGLLGSSTDGISGAMHEYSPSHYMATLTPVGAGSSPIAREVSLSANQKIKDFVVISYGQLQVDLSKGTGEYLSSLLSMLNIPAAETAETVKKLRALSEVYRVIPEFADRVIDLVHTAAASKPEEIPTAPPELPFAAPRSEK